MKFRHDCNRNEFSHLAFVIRTLVKHPILVNLTLTELNFIDKNASVMFRQFMQEIRYVFEKSVRLNEDETRKRMREVCSLPSDKTRTIGPRVKEAFLWALDSWENSRCA